MLRRSSRLRGAHLVAPAQEPEVAESPPIITLSSPLLSSDDESQGVQSNDGSPRSPEAAAPGHDAPRNVIAMIEDIFDAVTVSIRRGADLSIPYRSTRGKGSRARSLTFPGRTAHEAKKFAAILRILEMAHEALITGKIITKRNIFYQYRALFRDQRVMDELVDDIALTLGVGRCDLNIGAAGKGLIAGGICLHVDDGSVVACDNNGVLIPSLNGLRRIDFGAARWILVIEKEATFRTLASSGYFRTSRAGPGILITGKGYPDLSTRRLLNRFHESRPDLPILGLVDYDPDGIKILRTYKVGSATLIHEENATVNTIRWLGIRLADVQQHHRIEPHDSPTFDGQHSAGTRRHSSNSAARPGGFEANTSPLTLRDRKMALAMIDKLTDVELDGEERQHLSELQTMLMMNIKAEIQAVDNLGDMTHWLDDKLCSG